VHIVGDFVKYVTSDVPAGQGVEQAGVYEHTLRLVERANHVLAQWVVDPGLPSHRRVNCGHHCGGYLQRSSELRMLLAPAEESTLATTVNGPCRDCQCLKSHSFATGRCSCDWGEGVAHHCNAAALNKDC